tara:strand:+ start:2754 stop:3107 length:354 start_codon:yes stop_codon:yes gene_type:complete
VYSEWLALTERLSALVETLAKDVDARLEHCHPLSPASLFAPSVRISVRLITLDPIRVDDEDGIVIQASIILTRLPHRVEIVTSDRDQRDNRGINAIHGNNLTKFILVKSRSPHYLAG